MNCLLALFVSSVLYVKIISVFENLMEILYMYVSVQQYTSLSIKCIYVIKIVNIRQSVYVCGLLGRTSGCPSLYLV